MKSDLVKSIVSEWSITSMTGKRSHKKTAEIKVVVVFQYLWCNLSHAYTGL